MSDVKISVKNRNDAIHGSYLQKADKTTVKQVEICEVKTKKTLVVDANTTIEGYARVENADPSEAIWQLKRTHVNGNVTSEDYAGVGETFGTFSFVFNDWESAFEPLTEVNEFSTLHDGVDEFLLLPFDAAVDFDANSQAFSVGCWQKRNGGLALTQTILSNLAFLSNPVLNGVALFGNNAVLSLLVNNDNSAGNSITKTFPGVVDTDWHHYMLTFDGAGNAAGINLYIDGVLVPPAFETDNLTASAASGTPWVFGSVANDFVFFPLFGHYDQPCLWNIELDADDVADIYNQGKVANLALHPKAAEDFTRLPYYLRNGDDAGDIFPTLKNLGNLGATLDTTMTNMEASDIVKVVP